MENSGIPYDLSSKTNLLMNTEVKQKLRGIQSSDFEKLKTKVRINLDLQIRMFLEGSIITDREHLDNNEKLCLKCNDTTSLNEKLLFTIINVKDFSLKEITMLKKII